MTEECDVKVDSYRQVWCKYCRGSGVSSDATLTDNASEAGRSKRGRCHGCNGAGILYVLARRVPGTDSVGVPYVPTSEPRPASP